MELFIYLLDFFGISVLGADATIVDLIMFMFVVFGALFLFTFVLRSLFLLLRFGQR